LNVLSFDYETNTFAKGNPHSKQGKAVCLGFKIDDCSTNCYFGSNMLDMPKDEFTTYKLVIAFNAKFDLLWNKKLGFTSPKQVWCCQLAEYLLDRQRPYPSLEETAKKYGLSSKLDIVKLEYWDKGVDTDEIPTQILESYCRQDVDLTFQIYNIQREVFSTKPALFRLFKLACQDLLTLVEMEWNGLKYNEQLCKERVENCKQIKWETILELEKGIFA